MRLTRPQPYIVLTPDMRTNESGQHLVVAVDEWCAITLGEQDSYTFASKHGDYLTAAAERDQLNDRDTSPAELPAAAPRIELQKAV